MKFNSILKSLSFALLIVGIGQSMMAMEKLNVKLSQIRLKAEEEHNKILLRNACNKTIWKAVTEGDITTFLDTLNHGADVNYADGYGFTLLHCASRHGHLEIVQTLLENGADIDRRETYHKTPLRIACEYGHLEIVKELLKRRANTNYADNDAYSGATPLGEALARNHMDIAKELIKNGADINLSANAWRTKPLHLACGNDSLEIVKELLDRGANVNDASNYYQDTPLHRAVPDLPITKELINRGASINCENKDGETPLYYAWNRLNLHKSSGFCSKRCLKCLDVLKIIELLLNRGASIESSIKEKSKEIRALFTSILGKENLDRETIIKLVSDEIKKQEDIKNRFIEDLVVRKYPLRFGTDEKSSKAQALIQSQSSIANKELSLLLHNSFVLQRDKIINAQQQGKIIKEEREKQQKILAKENKSFLKRILSFCPDSA